MGVIICFLVLLSILLYVKWQNTEYERVIEYIRYRSELLELKLDRTFTEILKGKK